MTEFSADRFGGTALVETSSPGALLIVGHPPDGCEEPIDTVFASTKQQEFGGSAIITPGSAVHPDVPGSDSVVALLNLLIVVQPFLTATDRTLH